MEHQLSFGYTQQSLTLAINVYNFPEDYKKRYRLRIRSMRYILQHRTRLPNICPSPRQILNHLEQLLRHIRDNNLSNQLLFEIVDIIQEHFPGRANEFLNYIRDEESDSEDEIDEQIFVQDEPKKKIRTVYEDSQNVHDTKINKSVIHATKTLYKMYQDKIQIFEGANIGNDKIDLLTSFSGILKSSHQNKAILIDNTMRYFRDSVATFGIGIGLADTFKSLCFWIYERKEYKTELENRLLEEFTGMKGMCTTGHLARLINVVQGYTDDENLCIRISDKAQLQASVKKYLTSSLQECTDDTVLEEMMTGGETYKKYIRKLVSEKLDIWMKDYGNDSLTTIMETINQFCRTTVFTK